MREPEEGQAVVAADVEEEVLPHVVRKLDGLDERHPQDVGVEVDGALHVAAYQREVVDAPQFEFAVLRSHERPPSMASLRSYRTRRPGRDAGASSLECR